MSFGMEFYRQGKQTRVVLGHCSAAGMICISGVGIISTLFSFGVWPFSAAAYWVPCYLLLGAAGAWISLCMKKYYRAFIGAGLAGMAAIMILPHTGSAFSQGRTDIAPNLRLLSANVYAPGNDPARLLDLIRETQPDIVLLQEVDARWQAFLKPIEREYLHSMYCPRYAGGGPDLAIFWNGESGEARELWPEDIPGAALQVDIDGQRVCLLNIHTAAPFTPVRARKYRQQMKLLREYANAQTTLLILAGDLNASPWSWEYKRLIADTSLKSVRNGMGLLGTWPSFFGPFRIALDHILITSEIQVSRCWTASGIGSDHLPLLVDLHVGMESR